MNTTEPYIVLEEDGTERVMNLYETRFAIMNVAVLYGIAALEVDELAAKNAPGQGERRVKCNQLHEQLKALVRHYTTMYGGGQL